MRKAKKTEYLLDIALFSWEDCEELCTDDLFFYGVTWKFPSMKKHKGRDVILSRDGKLELCGEDGTVAIKQSLFDIPEFRKALFDKLKKYDT